MKVRVHLMEIMGRPAVDLDEAGMGVLDLPEGAHLATALARLDLPVTESYVVLVNDEAVPAGERAARALAPGDSLTVFPPIKGG